MNCTRLIHPLIHHIWPLALRAIRRRIRRHAMKAAAAGVTIVCAAPIPAALWVALPPGGVVVPPVEDAVRLAPASIPEPGGLAVFVLGVGVVVGLRRIEGSKA